MLTDGLTPVEICRKALPAFTIECLGEYDIAYRCACSRDKVEQALLSTGEGGLAEMAQDPYTEVTCHFCDKVYTFTAEEIKTLAKKAKS